MKKLLLVALLLIIALAAYAASVTLAWTPSPDASVVGYRLYWGASSRVYSNSVTVGNVRTSTIPDLGMSTFYVFAATAYDSSGVESEFSNEVAYTTPDTNQPNPKPKSPIGVHVIQP